MINPNLPASGGETGDSSVPVARRRTPDPSSDLRRLFESEQQARRRTERLMRVSSGLVAAVTPDAIAREVAREATAALGARGTVFALLTDDSSTFEVATSTGYPEDAMRTWQRFSNAGALPFPHVARTREPLFVQTAAEHRELFPSLAEAFSNQQLEASAVLPLISGGRILGAFSVEFTESRLFLEEEREFLVTIASQTALALDRARLYERERIARAEAEQANRAKSDFLAVMSHELRTPLNAISGYIDLMRAGVHGPLLPAYEAYADRIRAAQKHLLSLIDNVLRFARIEAGQITYTIAELSVGAQMASIIALVEPQITSKDLTLTCHTVQPELRVLADGEKLTQILLNLLSNAIKFTPAGGTIVLSAAADDKHVDIQVADTGAGIPEDQLDLIFEPFVQVDNTLTRESEGVGLGLTISRDLARAMGGDLSAANASDQGSVFTLTLPAA